MNHFTFLIFILFASPVYSQVILSADGPGDTYELITSILAPGESPIETPDCSHEDFGNHIDELYDEELDAFVFRFHIHVTPDDDRCINFDRQRNEIKSYSKSPDNLLGIEEEEVIYKWKFKLEDGFQSSPNFTHLHQLKSVGGSQESMPMYTLTTREGSPDRLELRYAETTSQVTLKQTDLAPMIGTWLEVTEKITYGFSGSYEIEIVRFSDKEVLFSFSDDNIINWRVGAEFVRPKWGIYRSLINEQDLRDEQVLFADFSVEEVGANSINNSKNPDWHVSSNYDSLSGNLTIRDLPSKELRIKFLDINGRMIASSTTEKSTEVILSIPNLIKGSYVLLIEDKNEYYSEVVLIK